MQTGILYSGGVKIYTDYDPEVQGIVEEYYKNTKNFPDSSAQSAIVVIDTKTGRIAGIAGGHRRKRRKPYSEQRQQARVSRVRV